MGLAAECAGDALISQRASDRLATEDAQQKRPNGRRLASLRPRRAQRQQGTPYGFTARVGLLDLTMQRIVLHLRQRHP